MVVLLGKLETLLHVCGHDEDKTRMLPNGRVHEYLSQYGASVLMETDICP